MVGTMLHKHHIIPRHAGGTDDPSNIVELTVAEHAQAHKELYRKYGRKEDFWAWKGLEGIISKEDIVYNQLCEASLKGAKKHSTLLKNNKEYRENWLNKMRQPKTNTENYFKPKSKEHAENIRKAALSRPRVECPHCGNGYTKANYQKHVRACENV